MRSKGSSISVFRWISLIGRAEYQTFCFRRGKRKHSKESSNYERKTCFTLNRTSTHDIQTSYGAETANNIREILDSSASASANHEFMCDRCFWPCVHLACSFLLLLLYWIDCTSNCSIYDLTCWVHFYRTNAFLKHYYIEMAVHQAAVSTSKLVEC